MSGDKSTAMKQALLDRLAKLAGLGCYEVSPGKLSWSRDNKHYDLNTLDGIATLWKERVGPLRWERCEGKWTACPNLRFVQIPDTDDEWADRATLLIKALE